MSMKIAGGPESHADDTAKKAKITSAPWGSELWKLCTYFDTSNHWEYSGILLRFIRIMVLHVWLIIAHPIDYWWKYTWMYSKLWYSENFIERVVFFCSPIVGCILLQFIALYKQELKTKAPWWSIPEESLIKSLLVGLEFELTPFVGGYWVMGTNEQAHRNSWHDFVGHKDYWRAVFLNTGTNFPPEVGRYEQGEAKFPAHQPPITHDVVAKIKDSGSGVGDRYWKFGEDFATNAELKNLLNKTYRSYDGWDKGYRNTLEKPDPSRKRKPLTVIVMEWMKPLDKYGVHSLDVLTVRTKDRGVECVQCLLWMDCRGNSSLSAKSGYVVDLDTETVCARADFYGWQFTQSSTAAVGIHIPGVRTAARRCMALHEQVEFPFMNTLAFDFMITPSVKHALDVNHHLTNPKGLTASFSPRAAKMMNWAKTITLGEDSDKGEAVFFDGSFACRKETQRLPRRIFMTWKTMLAFFIRFETTYTHFIEKIVFGVQNSVPLAKFMLSQPLTFAKLVVKNKNFPTNADREENKTAFEENKSQPKKTPSKKAQSIRAKQYGK